MKVQRLPKEYLAGFGMRFKLVRTALGLDQFEMAKALETAQSQVSRIEMGKTGPSLHQLLVIKQLAEESDSLKDMTWEWLLQGRGRGLIE